MNSYCEAAHHSAAAQLVQFAQSDGARPTLREYGQFLRTEKGQLVWNELAALADDLLCAVLKIREYDFRVSLLAIWAEIPLEKFRVIARLSVEFQRCIFYGAGDIPMVDVSSHEGVGGA